MNLKKRGHVLDSSESGYRHKAGSGDYDPWVLKNVRAFFTKQVLASQKGLISMKLPIISN